MCGLRRVLSRSREVDTSEGLLQLQGVAGVNKDTLRMSCSLLLRAHARASMLPLTAHTRVLPRTAGVRQLRCSGACNPAAAAPAAGRLKCRLTVVVCNAGTAEKKSAGVSSSLPPDAGRTPKSKKMRLDEVCLQQQPQHSRNVIQSWIQQGTFTSTVPRTYLCGG